MAKWKVCPFRPQPLQVVIRFEHHLVVVKVFLTALCLQATVQKNHSVFHSATNQEYKLVQWSNCLMATWRCCEKAKTWNPKGNVWELEYCQLENVRFCSFPIPSISYQCFFHSPRIADSRPGFLYLLLGPSQNLTKSSPPESRAITITKTASWKCIFILGSFPVRCHPKIWEGKSLATFPLYFHLRKPLLQCHFHEEMNLPGILFSIGKRICTVNPSQDL